MLSNDHASEVDLHTEPCTFLSRWQCYPRVQASSCYMFPQSEVELSYKDSDNEIKESIECYCRLCVENSLSGAWSFLCLFACGCLSTRKETYIIGCFKTVPLFDSPAQLIYARSSLFFFSNNDLNAHGRFQGPNLCSDLSKKPWRVA